MEQDKVAKGGRRKQKIFGKGKGLSQAINDPALVEVVRGHFELHAVAVGEADEAFAHLSGDVRENLVLIGEFDTEHGARENGDDLAFGFDKLGCLHREKLRAGDQGQSSGVRLRPKATDVPSSQRRREKRRRDSL